MSEYQRKFSADSAATLEAAQQLLQGLIDQSDTREGAVLPPHLRKRYVDAVYAVRIAAQCFRTLEAENTPPDVRWPT